MNRIARYYFRKFNGSRGGTEGGRSGGYVARSRVAERNAGRYINLADGADGVGRASERASETGGAGQGRNV